MKVMLVEQNFLKMYFHHNKFSLTIKITQKHWRYDTYTLHKASQNSVFTMLYGVMSL